MLGHTFYHSLLRQYSIMTGNLFNDIVVRRTDPGGNAVTVIQVPIQYGPKRKWAVALATDPTARTVAVQYPRLSFFFNSVTPDLTRQLSPLNRLANITEDKNTMYSMFQPLPVTIDMELCAVAKNMDDAAQIAEQIFPYFSPDFTQSAKLVPTINKVWDVVFRLRENQIEEIYDGAFDKRQSILWTFHFNVDAWMFGPVQKQGVIKRVQADIMAVPGDGPVTAAEIHKYGRVSRIEVTPGLTADGKPTTVRSESVPWASINQEDDYGFCETITEYTDGLKYDPVSGDDRVVKDV